MQQIKKNILKIVFGIAAGFAVLIIGLIWWFQSGFDDMAHFCANIDKGSTLNAIEQRANAHGYHVYHEGNHLLINTYNDFRRAICIIDMVDGHSTTSRYQLLEKP